MAKRRVVSTNLRAVAYDSATKQLTIDFRSNAIYRYANVPKRTVTALLKSASKGRFLNERIVPRFDATRLRKWGKVK